MRASNINPSILKWARETARLSKEEAAHKLGLADTNSETSAEKLDKLEAGKAFPTRNQLLKIASVYHRPLTLFYMDTPPQKNKGGEDFRTISGSPSPEADGLLDALRRDITARQEMLKSILEDEHVAPKLPFVGSVHLADTIESTVRKIRKILGEETYLGKKKIDPETRFKELRTKVESAGIFVLLMGNLGNHHTKIDEKIFRGYVISDDIAPVVVINDQDAKVARSFTLIHEVAHIFLGKTGISGTLSDLENHVNANRVEIFCNKIAAEFLLPADQLEKPKSNDKEDFPFAAAKLIAERWGVSEAMAAYRIHQLGWISNPAYKLLQKHYAERWAALKKKQKEKNEGREGGPSYYTVRTFLLGNALISLVCRTIRENTLTHTKAAKILGIKPSNVEALLRKFETRQPSTIF